MNASVQTENITVWEFLSRKNVKNVYMILLYVILFFYEKAVIYSVIAVEALKVFLIYFDSQFGKMCTNTHQTVKGVLLRCKILGLCVGKLNCVFL